MTKIVNSMSAAKLCLCALGVLGAASFVLPLMVFDRPAHSMNIGMYQSAGNDRGAVGLRIADSDGGKDGGGDTHKTDDGKDKDKNPA